MKSGQSPYYMVEHFIQESFIHSNGIRFRETGCFLLYNSKVLEINHFHIRTVFYGTISLVKTGNIQRKISPLQSPFVSTGQALLCQSVILRTDFFYPFLTHDRFLCSLFCVDHSIGQHSTF